MTKEGVFVNYINKAKRFLTSTFDIRYSIFCGSKYSPYGNKPGYYSSLKIVKSMNGINLILAQKGESNDK